MNRLKSLTKNQREAVSDFLVAITRELPPGMMVKLLRKVIVDIPEMGENALVPLRVSAVTIFLNTYAKILFLTDCFLYYRHTRERVGRVSRWELIRRQ